MLFSKKVLYIEVISSTSLATADERPDIVGVLSVGSHAIQVIGIGEGANEYEDEGPAEEPGGRINVRGRPARRYHRARGG